MDSEFPKFARFVGDFKFRQRIACSCCMLSGTAVSVANNWFTPLVGQLSRADSPVPMTSDTVGWLVSIIYLVEAIGATLAGYLGDRWGRKPALLMIFPFLGVSWLVTGIFKSVAGLVVARLFQGIATGFVYTLAPVYSAEVSSAELRGQLGAYLQTFWNTGLLYVFAVGPLLGYQTYVVVSAVPTLLFLLAFMWMPETPYYLMMKGREEEAEAVLSWLRDGSDTSEEMDSIRQEIGVEAGRWQDLFQTSKYRRNLAVVILIYGVRFLGGMDSAPLYVIEMMQREGFQSPYLLSLLLGLALVVSSICSSLLSDRFGRRPLLLLAVTISSFSTMLVAVSSYYKLSQFLLFAGLLSFLSASNLGLIPVLDVLQAEYFPSHIRAFAGSFATVISDVFLFISMKQYQVFEDYFDVYCNYLFFSIICFTGLIVLFPTLSETANKSLGELHS